MTLNHFTLTNDFYIGYSEIDYQHEGFFEIYNELADKLSGGAKATARDIAIVFNKLFMYTKYHFKEEEWIMKSRAYPLLREHSDRHHEIVAHLTKARLTTSSYDGLIYEIESLVYVWAEHILVVDKKLGKFLGEGIANSLLSSIDRF